MDALSSPRHRLIEVALQCTKKSIPEREKDSKTRWGERVRVKLNNTMNTKSTMNTTSTNTVNITNTIRTINTTKT